MFEGKEQVVIMIIVATVLILFFVIIIISFALVYQKRKNSYYKEKQDLQTFFQQNMLQSQLEMQEQTFSTISREIHDNVGQILSLAKVQLNILDKSESFDKTLLEDAKESVSKAMTDLRDIAKSLSTERIQISSLPEITNHELQRINRSGFMLTSLCVEGEEQEIVEQKKLIIFRIIQEGLHNILKHSLAKNIDVDFCYAIDKLTINIEDNGIGFDKDLLTKKDGLGLHNIVNRAALIGGEAHVNSIINKGTVVTIISPYE